MPTHSDAKTPHTWKLRRMGGIFQAQINQVSDLRALNQLDPKLWVALSCPVDDLEIDRTTLKLIDNDHDGRVRIEEMLHAVRWTLERLSQPESLFQGGDLPLAAIRTDDPEGAALLASAKQILTNTNADDATHISVEQSTNTAKIFGQSRYNGDGILSKEATDDPKLTQLITEIIDCLGADKDRNGKDGIGQAKLDQFFNELTSYATWWTRGESTANHEVFPLAEATPQAYTSLCTIEAKLDDYYARCQLAAFDKRAQAPLNHEISRYQTIAEQDLSSGHTSVEQLPLAQITPELSLPLSSTAINPQWQSRAHALIADVVQPLFPNQHENLSLTNWQTIKKRFSGYRTWLSTKPTTTVEKLGIVRVNELLDSDLQAQLAAMLAEDRALAPRMQAVDAVEKLARMHRDLIRVLNNFVNFNDFYADDRSASFQAGTLYLDGRECRLCLRITDPAKHAALASLSRAFIAYCQCKRKDTPGKFYIAAVVSAGDSANLIVGRNGIFRDHQGRLWDTTIIRLIENPISIREAFLMPYIRVGRFISSQLEKWAMSRDKAIQKQLETGVQAVGSNTQNAKPNKANLPALGGVAGMLAAGGIALGAVGAGVASLFETLKTLNWWEIPIVFAAVILLISLPSMVIAWLKIRQRTLAPLLDASGWAVNGRTLIRPQLGRRLTKQASLPLDAECQFDEPVGIHKGLWIALGLSALTVTIGWLLIFL